MAKTGEMGICKKCKKEKKIKAKGLCANCYRVELAKEKKGEKKREPRALKTGRAIKKQNLFKRLFSEIQKLTRELSKENIKREKEISRFLKERKDVMKRFLTLRKDLLKQCHRNKQLREQILEAQETETAEAIADLDAATHKDKLEKSGDEN